MLDDPFLFPEAHQVLEEAISRHGDVWPFVYEAISLAHHCYQWQRDVTAQVIPGTPHIRAVRTDINDFCWRYFRSITDPLVDQGLISEITQSDNGEVMILPDGLHVRIKKANRDGSTSNYPTAKIARMDLRASQSCLFAQATELDQYIMAGNWIDAVFVVDETLTGFDQVGLKYAVATTSPFALLAQPTDGQLALISPNAFNLIVDARNRLTA